MFCEQKFAAEALALVGAPFRLHGRNAEDGVDCVGLVALAALRAGRSLPELPPYRLRGTSIEKVRGAMARCGLVLIETARAGAILLAESGPMQLHLMVQTEQGVVHAHAGLGRVVLSPAPSLWPLIGAWRFPPFTEQG